MSAEYLIIDEAFLEEKVYQVIRQLGATLRVDVLEAMRNARQTERNERAQNTLDLIIQNAEIARDDDMPLCQDTGTAWIVLELASQVCVQGDLQAAASRAVARAYAEAGLRMSLVYDGLLNRTNTGDNTPAFLDIVLSKSNQTRLSVMLKGAGSDNASRLVMLNPDDSWEGVKQTVLAAVHEKAAMACPPLIIGVGVGSTFDKVASLSKRSLLRSIGVPNSNPQLTAYEKELLDLVNQTGFGPGGLGGDTTALAVHIESAPCHIAALPVAVNLMCSALRSHTEILFD